MRTVDLIAKKRDNFPLDREEIDYLVKGFTAGEIPDYQMSALLMAICWRGMNISETVSLTNSMVNTGAVLDLTSISPMTVDKHSTGGVGDKATLVVAPIVAASGVVIAKMAGRGLGFTGGTIDKLESFPGFRVGLTIEGFLSNLRRHGIAIISQSSELVPADAKLYALRDVTATVESIPLIAASIMSKKIAAGANIIALDVKAGKGAFMKTIEQALDLARIMVNIGQASGKKTFAVVSDMEQPLGKAIGNSLEVKEAIATLRGVGPEDLHELSLDLSARILLAARASTDLASARKGLEKLLNSGAALDKLAELVKAQGGDPRQVYEPELLETASVIKTVDSTRSGFVSSLDAHAIGLAAMQLGAGRSKKDDSIDHAVGIVLAVKIGDFVEAGGPLVTVHARQEKDVAAIAEQIREAYGISEARVEKRQLISTIIPSEAL